MIIAKYRKDRYRKKHPSAANTFVLIEVSDSTLNTDRTVKLPIYAAAKIPEYWIVDVKKECIEQYTLPKGDSYTSMKVIKKNEVISCESVDFSIKVADLFI